MDSMLIYIIANLIKKKKLNEREYEIISMRFFEGKTQIEVSEIIGISQAQVSRLEKNALKIMRNYYI